MFFFTVFYNDKPSVVFSSDIHDDMTSARQFAIRAGFAVSGMRFVQTLKNVVCEVCGNEWDTQSPCAPCYTDSLYCY